MSQSTLHAGLRAFLHLTQNLDDRFKRRALWSPRHLMVALLLLCYPGHRMSYRSTLGMLTRFGSRLLSWSRVPTVGSMSKARSKMTVAMCRSFLAHLSASATRGLVTPRHVWRGRTLYGVDGTWLVTRRSPDTLKHFRCPGGGGDTEAHHPRALMVAAVDLLRRVPLDFVVGRKGQGERTLIKDMVDSFVAGSVVVIDRGFPSRDLLASLLERDIDVVMRVSADTANSWKEFQPFLTGKAKTKRTVIARLVERDRQRGRPRKGTKKERMVILTTLSEADGFTRDEIVKIYGARWGIETAFREMKSFAGLEPLHTKTALGVEQEVAAAMIWMTIASLLESTALDGLPDGMKVIRTDCYRYAGLLLGDFLAGRWTQSGFNELVTALQKYAYQPKPGRYAERICHDPYGRSRKQFG
jgi:transposase